MGLSRTVKSPEDAYANPAMGGLYMTQAELAHWRRRSLRRIYLQPRYILRTLRSARSPKELANYIKFGALTLKDLVMGKAPTQTGSTTD